MTLFCDFVHLFDQIYDIVYLLLHMYLAKGMIMTSCCCLESSISISAPKNPRGPVYDLVCLYHLDYIWVQYRTTYTYSVYVYLVTHSNIM